MKFFCCTKQELVRGEKKWIAYEYKNISKCFTFYNNCSAAIRVAQVHVSSALELVSCVRITGGNILQSARLVK